MSSKVLSNFPASSVSFPLRGKFTINFFSWISILLSFNNAFIRGCLKAIYLTISGHSNFKSTSVLFSYSISIITSFISNLFSKYLSKSYKSAILMQPLAINFSSSLFVFLNRLIVLIFESFKAMLFEL